MKRFLNKYRAALEDANGPEDTSGETGVEREHIVWVKLKDIDDVAKFDWSVSDHEVIYPREIRQVKINVEKTEQNFIGGMIRVREITDYESNVTYELTLKQSHSEEGKEFTETMIPATKDLFVQMAGLADDMVTKHRYYIPVAGSDMVWEVELAPNGEGGYHQWARMEIEVTNLDEPLPVIPFPTEEIILPPGFGDMEKAEWEQKNQELFDSLYVQKGPLVEYTHPDAPEEADENAVSEDVKEEEDSDSDSDDTSDSDSEE